jgi:hypothetical protein
VTDALLLRKMTRMAHRDTHRRIEFVVGIGGTADVDGQAALVNNGAHDPNRTIAGPNSRIAAIP